MGIKSNSNREALQAATNPKGITDSWQCTNPVF